MPRDYSDLADRFGDDVPGVHQDQSGIREWIDSNIDWGDDVGRDEKLTDEVAKRIARDRGDEAAEQPRDSDGTFVHYPGSDGFEEGGDL